VDQELIDRWTCGDKTVRRRGTFSSSAGRVDQSIFQSQAPPISADGNAGLQLVIHAIAVLETGIYLEESRAKTEHLLELSTKQINITIAELIGDLRDAQSWLTQEHRGEPDSLI
jgi:hypothetical protein